MMWNMSTSGYGYMYNNVLMCIVTPEDNWSNTLTIRGYSFCLMLKQQQCVFWIEEDLGSGSELQMASDLCMLP